MRKRLTRDGNALQSEAASSISSGLSVVGKIIGDGALTIFGHVEGEVRASTIVIAEGAQMEGEVSAEELTPLSTIGDSAGPHDRPAATRH